MDSSNSPSTARAASEMFVFAGVRGALPAVQAPTLVLLSAWNIRAGTEDSGNVSWQDLSRCSLRCGTSLVETVTWRIRWSVTGLSTSSCSLLM